MSESKSQRKVALEARRSFHWSSFILVVYILAIRPSSMYAGGASLSRVRRSGMHVKVLVEVIAGRSDTCRTRFPECPSSVGPSREAYGLQGGGGAQNHVDTTPTLSQRRYPEIPEGVFLPLLEGLPAPAAASSSRPVGSRGRP